MSFESIGLWGCERSGYLDLWNNMRTVSYIEDHSLERNTLRDGSFVDVSDVVGTEDLPINVPSLTVFTNPIDDEAWWYDPIRPESAWFLGMQVIRVDGLESSVITQEADMLLDQLSTLSWRKKVNNGFTITVEAVLSGMDCCATAYGLRALRRKLAACCDGACGGTRLRMLLAPRTDASAVCSDTWTPPSISSAPLWRTALNCRLIDQPQVVSGTGVTCGGCGCQPLTRITFTLRAQGELYLDPLTMLNRVGLANGCYVECSAPCATPTDLTLDPSVSVGPLPSAPNAVLPSAPVFVQQQWQVLDTRSRDFETELEIEVFAGASDLRGISVRGWVYNPSIGYSTGLYTPCNACISFGTPYIPAYATWSRTVCNGAQVKKAPRSQRGLLLDADWRFPDPSMRITSRYVLLSIEAEQGVDSNAWMSVYARTVEP